MADFTPAKTGSSRAFLIKGRARPDHEPLFQSCLMSDTLEQAFGDIEDIECPDPTQHNQYVKVGEIQGQVERPTLSLMGRYAQDLKSTMLELAKKRCAFDLQVHFGACTDPRLFNEFTKAIILEQARATNYSTDTLGSLQSGDEAAINENADTSGREVYEVVRLSFAEEGGDVVTNPLNDVVICSQVNCGDCDDEDGGCDKIYAVGESTSGSPGTPPDIVFSINGGVTWYATDINTIAVGSGADGVACLGKYVVVVSEDECAIHYIEKAQLDATPPVAGFTQITTGCSGVNYPQDIWSVGTYAFIVGLNGYIYGTSDPTAGVTVLDAGVATTENLEAVHAISDKFAVAVGANAAIVRTENRTTWNEVTTGPTGVTDNFTCVWVKNTNEWWIGTDAGEVYYTLDGGVTWTQKAMPGTAPTTINDISFSTDSVAYISAVVSSNGRMYRSYDGGYSWNVLPEDGGVFPANDQMAAISACPNDANFVVGVGTADNATDGFLVLGQA